MIGKTISHYKIIEKLGEGGMGEVYLAEDTHLLRNVALKILPENLLTDKNNKIRFIKEAQTASSLNHPNICIIHDINEYESKNFIVMEYVECKTLRQIIDECSPLKEEEVLDISIKICDALSAVHSKGILHRDIKPENIMISNSGYLKVMDFGLAKLATDTAEMTAQIKFAKDTTIDEHKKNINYSKDVVLNTLSGLFGTVCYMSPEQALGTALDHRSDIFSLGIVLYELLTGIRPFDGNSNDTILSKIIIDPLTPIHISTKNISPKMEKIIDRCLEKDPKKRYKSMSRLLLDLLSIKQELDSTKLEIENKNEIQSYEQERRQVTVTFLEIANYKNITTQKDPEEAANTINQFYDLLALVVEKYYGRIEKIISGNIQIVYGAPVASENSHKEAVNTAIEIRNKVSEFNQNRLIQIEIKIGINSGHVIAGIMRTDEKKNYSVFGETVNFASNLKDISSKDQILVGGLTHKLTKNEFEYKEVQAIFLKENQSEAKIFELLSKKEKIHRALLGTERMIYSVMVGRNEEVKLLETYLEKLHNGQGKIVNVIGEAGIGKSRLIAEFKSKVENTKVNFLEGRALSIGKNLSFHPLIDLLKNWAGITEDDSNNEVFQKLEQLIININSQNVGEIFPFIATMMGIELAGKYAERVKGIQGAALEKLILKNLREFIEKATCQKPVIFVIEDLHWADATTVEFVELLFRLAENNPILFINIFRPNYKETGERILETIKSRYSNIHQEIYLESLDNKDGELLIKNLINIENFPKNITDLIVNRAGGNPFFIEEVAQSFIDEGVIKIKNGKFIATEKINSVVIPETINELLMTRIDKLDEQTKSLVKKASVIGRNFFYKVIREVADNLDDLDDKLSYLLDIQLIKENKRIDEVEYLFKHALVQTVAYESILQKRRKELHLKTAIAIESVFADKLPQFYGILSYHFNSGEDFDKAEEYLIKAGQEALKSSASSEAIEYFKEGLNLYINKYGSSVDPKKKAMLELNIAIALQNKGRLVESVEYFDRVQLYYKLNLPKNQLFALVKVILGFGNLLVGIYLPSLKWKKIPNAKEKEIEDFLLHFNNSVTHVNPKRGFMEILNQKNRLTKIDFSYCEINRENLIGTGATFSFIGISSSVHKKLLDLVREKRDKNSAREEIWFRFSEQMYNWVWGHWKILPENDYNDNLVNIALKIGDVQNVTLYMNQYILTKIERGDFSEVHVLISKIDEIGEIYENNYPRELKYVSKTKFLIKKRLLFEAIKEAEAGIEFNIKTNFLEFLFELLSYKPRIEILLGDLQKAEKSLEYARTFRSKIVPPWDLTDFLTSQFLIDIYKLESALRKENKLEVAEYKKKTFKSAKEAYKISKKIAADRIEIYRLMGRYNWLINKKKKALKWWAKSIQFGEKSGGRLELSRTYFEIGKRLNEEKSKFNELNGITTKEYLEKAKMMFEEMDLKWDLEELGKVLENKKN